MGVNIRITSGPAVERTGDLAAILTNLRNHDILFIDEIHRLSRAVEEVLYPAMEDFALDIIIGEGTRCPEPEAKPARLYPDWCHHPLCSAEPALERPIWRRLPPRFLRPSSYRNNPQALEPHSPGKSGGGRAKGNSPPG